MKRWIFPGFLALLFTAVLLIGLVPWDRVLPEKEELPADAVEIGTLDTVQPLKGDYTIQYDDPDDPEGGVTVTYHVPSVGDFPMHYDSIDDVPRSTTMTFHTPEGDFVVLFGDGDSVPVPVAENTSTEWAISSPGTVNVEGDPSYCRTRKGDKTRWVIYLAGGGMSLDAYTAEQPGTFYTTGTAWNGIWNNAFFVKEESNPFADWSYLLIPCDTADCYIGAGQFIGVRGTFLNHNGYENFTAYLDSFRRTTIGVNAEPEKILLAGSSAGGFGAAMLASTVCERFPDTEVTVLVDCACLSADWQRIAREVWHAPKEITDRMTTDDCVTDALIAAAETYGDRLKILYLAVENDATLISYQNYIDRGEFVYFKDARDHYDRTLKAAVKRLREEVPDAGIWICRRSPAEVLTSPMHMLIPRFGSRIDTGSELLTNWLSWVWNTVMHDDAPPLSYGLDGFLDD